MPLEDAQYIDQLNPAWPLGSDGINTSDDHHRNTKKAVQQSFPNIDAAVTLTADELNGLIDRVTALEPVYVPEVDIGGQATQQFDMEGVTRAQFMIDFFSAETAGAGIFWRVLVGGVADATSSYRVTSAVGDDGQPFDCIDQNTRFEFSQTSDVSNYTGLVEFNLINPAENHWSYSYIVGRRGAPGMSMAGGAFRGGAAKPVNGFQAVANANFSSGTLVSAKWWK